VHLKDCSRWPERAECAQECLAQVEADPEGSRVTAIVERWYAKKRCVYCSKPIHADDRIDNWLDHKPALAGVDQMSKQWNEVAPQSLPRRLAQSRAVCWSCHEAEAFRREFPEVVVDRPRRH
jgi:hypothetical protein